MDVSPFPHHAPLPPERVQGRDDLLELLTAKVTQRRPTALIGPRRYGKTSVLARLAADLAEVSTVMVDLYEVTSAATLLARIDAAIAAAPAPYRQAAEPIAATVGINLGAIRAELSRPPRSRPDPGVLLEGVLRILVETAVRTPTLLVIDEFSSIKRVDGAAGAIRTAVQHHVDDLGLIFAGSQPSVMQQLFADRAEPFYAQADIVEIGPLNLAATITIVTDGFERTGRNAGPLGGLIHAFSGGHPHRTMQLADACWAATPAGATADEGVYGVGLQAVRAAADSAMPHLFDHLQPGERDVLRVIAADGALFGREGNTLGLTTGAAQHARDALRRAGELVVDGHDSLRITDPLMADWIRRRLPIP